jgi:hypothetical protein
MVNAFGTPARHPQSGIYLFRKRVPERLQESVGKSEIKFSLHTREPRLANHLAASRNSTSGKKLRSVGLSDTPWFMITSGNGLSPTGRTR